VAKKFGRRAKGKSQETTGLGGDPRTMFGAPPLPRQAHRPASSTPLAEYLDRGWPGVDPGYVVVPRSIAESMSLPWQQQLVSLLGQFHETHGGLAWPIYRVVPSRYELLVDLDEEQLAEAGYLVEIDGDGEMVYRMRSGRKVEDPEETRVLVPCLDPIVRKPAGEAPPPTQAPARSHRIDPTGPPARPTRAGGAAPGTPRPAAPMNIGPQPVWQTTPNGRTGAAAEPDQHRPPATHDGPAASAARSPMRPAAPAGQNASAPPSAPPSAASPAIPAVPPAPQSQAQRPTVSAPVAPAPAKPNPPVAERPAQRSPEATNPQDANPADDTATPPRGFRAPVTEDELELLDDGTFGPTGEPTEIPYRYKP